MFNARACRFATGALLATLATTALSAAAQPTLSFVASQAAPTGIAEIVSYDKFTNQLFTTSGTGIDVYNFGVGSDFASTSTIDLSGLFGGNLGSVSSVAIDPLGRGFGAALAIPSANLTSLGSVVLFDTTTGAILKTLSTGYNPDMVTFTPDGGSILIANEGEASTDPASPLDPEGSLGILNVAGKSYGDLASLTATDLSTYNFAPSNLVNPADLTGLRIDPRNASTVNLDLEPEYISVSQGKAYVSLQENSAVAVFDLATKKWTNIHNIDGKTQIVDASDRDLNDTTNDGAVHIDDAIFGKFMPDAIATYVVGGTTYFVTANEGDARDGLVGEESRIKDLALSAFDPALVASLNAIYTDGFQEDHNLGRLNITTIDGDTDKDGDIDVLTMYGTRSFSIFNGDTGALVYDSGSDFETITSTLVASIYNSEDNDPGEFDKRSDNKGPEPESVAITQFDGKTIAAIALERTGGIMLYDITDPTNAIFLQYLNSAVDNATGSVSPEGLAWVTAADSPTGETFLVVSYEVSGTVDIFTLVPEPGSLALLSVGGLLLARRRRGIA